MYSKQMDLEELTIVMLCEMHFGRNIESEVRSYAGKDDYRY